MGLSTAPNTFQLLMDTVLHGLTFYACLCYLDDILIFSETFQQHISDLDEIFSRLGSAGLKLGPKKCSFAHQSCIYLDGIRPPHDRATAVQVFAKPTTVNALKRFLGLMNWFRKNIPNYAAVAQPLLRLIKNNQKCVWTSEQDSAFTKLKDLLALSDILEFPRYRITLIRSALYRTFTMWLGSDRNRSILVWANETRTVRCSNQYFRLCWLLAGPSLYCWVRPSGVKASVSDEISWSDIWEMVVDTTTFQF